MSTVVVLTKTVAVLGDAIAHYQEQAERFRVGVKENQNETTKLGRLVETMKAELADAKLRRDLRYLLAEKRPDPLAFKAAPEPDRIVTDYDWAMLDVVAAGRVIVEALRGDADPRRGEAALKVALATLDAINPIDARREAVEREKADKRLRDAASALRENFPDGAHPAKVGPDTAAAINAVIEAV